MIKKNKWYFSWPAIVVWLLIIQFLGQCYIQRLPDTADNYYKLVAFIFLYVVVATLVIVCKYEQERNSKFQEWAKQDREKQKLIDHIKELEETVEKLKNDNQPKDEQ